MYIFFPLKGVIQNLVNEVLLNTFENSGEADRCIGTVSHKSPPPPLKYWTISNSAYFIENTFSFVHVQLNANCKKLIMPVYNFLFKVLNHIFGCIGTYSYLRTLLVEFVCTHIKVLSSHAFLTFLPPQTSQTACYGLFTLVWWNRRILQKCSWKSTVIVFM